MKQKIKNRLKQLNDDYKDNSRDNSYFKYFFCPILFQDENVELCQAHIVNSNFKDITSEWTVQRKDIDNFYGTHFESNFTKLQYDGISLEDVLSNKELYNKLRPRLMRGNQKIDIYPYESNNSLPENHSLFTFEDTEKLFGIRLDSSEINRTKDEIWSLEYQADLTLDAIPSLIKAGYLTIFYLFGYRTVLSQLGQEIGKHILGQFFIENKDIRDRDEVRENALSHFLQYRCLVRPLEKLSWDSKGTSSDKIFFACRNVRNETWATMIIIKTGGNVPLHVVLIPTLDSVGTVETYYLLLEGKLKGFEIALCMFEAGKDIIQCETSWKYTEWDVEQKMG